VLDALDVASAAAVELDDAVDDSRAVVSVVAFDAHAVSAVSETAVPRASERRRRIESSWCGDRRRTSVWTPGKGRV
jgi:hypothetical protein